MAEEGSRGFFEAAFPGLGFYLSPLHLESLAGTPGQPGLHGRVREVEDRGAAVASMGEEKAPPGFVGTGSSGGAESDFQGETGEGRVGVGDGGQGRQGGVGWMDLVTQAAGEVEAGAVAAGSRQRKAAGGQDDRGGREAILVGEMDGPRGARGGGRREVHDPGLEAELHPLAPGEGVEAVPHVSGPV